MPKNKEGSQGASKPLLLNGKPFRVGKPRPALERFIAFLDHAPDNEVFDAQELRDKFTHHISAWKRGPELAGYWVLVGGKLLFGNPKAIARVKKEYGGEM